MVASSFLCPFVIVEVVSQHNESNWYHMLLQSIVLAHAGQYLVKAGATFFVIAIYLHRNLIAERYIVTQTGPGTQVCHSVCFFSFASYTEVRYVEIMVGAKGICPGQKNSVARGNCARKYKKS